MWTRARSRICERGAELKAATAPTQYSPNHAKHDRLGDNYSGNEAKARPFTGGMKPTTGNLPTLVATAKIRCLHNIR